MRVEGPTNMYAENEPVTKSVAMPESILMKNHLSICYHVVSESVAVGKVQIGQVPTGRNLSDYLTKVLDGPKIREVVRKILH